MFSISIFKTFGKGCQLLAQEQMAPVFFKLFFTLVPSQFINISMHCYIGGNYNFLLGVTKTDNGFNKKCFKMMNPCTFRDLKAIIDILSSFKLPRLPSSYVQLKY